MPKNPQTKGLYVFVRVNLRLLCLGLLALGLAVAAVVTVSAVAAPQGVEVPVVMYHSLLKDPARQGTYVVTPAEFERDLLYLKEHGYTTVLMEDLIAYTQGGDLPEKPVLITFDDGYYNNYLYAFAIAQQYGCKFVLSPIGRYADAYSETGETNAYYSHATWDHLKEMQDSGLVEIQNHSYDLHQKRQGALGAKRRPGEEEAAYRSRLNADLTKAQEAIRTHLGKAPTTFVYPFGAASDTTPEIVKSLGFSASLSCREQVSRITRNPDSLYSLGRYRRPSGVSSAQFFEKIMGLSAP